MKMTRPDDVVTDLDEISLYRPERRKRFGKREPVTGMGGEGGAASASAGIVGAFASASEIQ